MKKFLKTLLIALILVPALFLVTACGGDNNGTPGGDGDGGSGGGGGTQTAQQKYDILRTAISKMSQKTSYTQTGLSNDTTTTTTTLQVKNNDNVWENFGTPDTNTETRKNKSVVTLNAQTGEYVDNSYNYVPATETTAETWELNLEDSEYIVRIETTGAATQWLHYYTDEQWGYDGEYSVAHAEYVSSDHAAHVYGFEDAATEMTAMVSGETFTSAVQNIISIVPMFTGMMYYGITEETHDITTIPETTFIKDGDNYTLQVEVDFSATQKEATAIVSNVPATGTSSQSLEGTVTFSILYTSEEITGYGTSMQMTSTVVTETDSSKSTVVTTTSGDESAQITYSYTETEMPEDFGDYEDAERVKAMVTAEIYLDGVHALGNNFAWGEDVTADVREGLESVEEYYAIPNTTIDGWYYDEACTQRVQPTDTFNFKSYDKPALYGKSVPDEGYALLVVQYGYVLPEDQIEMAKMYGATVEEDGFYAMDTETFAVAITETLELLETCNIYGYTYDVTQTMVDGTVVTENVTNLESGHVYNVKIYVDYASRRMAD